MRIHSPFSASGTATFPGHRFFFAPEDDPDTVLHLFIVDKYPDNIQVYDPYLVEGDTEQTEANLSVLTPEERSKYDQWRATLSFHEQYKTFTGRSYLANYLRKPPSHHMWRADYFGQEHWATTRETHFVKEPPADALEPILAAGKQRSLKEPLLKEYRQPDEEILNMTMKVISCAPRAFEIQNFLSEIEVEHLLNLASTFDLELSSTGDILNGEKAEKGADTRRTRTSMNSWIPREQSQIVDAIYRRAADLLRIDEALMRRRSADEYPDLETKQTIAESLQMVHYKDKQEYTAHHDFGFSRIGDDNQGARFATVLLYLNEGMTGGETSFPRWVNAESFKELAITPQAGKAVLFYSQLPGKLISVVPGGALVSSSAETKLTHPHFLFLGQTVI
jgi:prolyl 4-hydroxylase